MCKNAEQNNTEIKHHKTGTFGGNVFSCMDLCLLPGINLIHAVTWGYISIFRILVLYLHTWSCVYILECMHAQELSLIMVRSWNHLNNSCVPKYSKQRCSHSKYRYWAGWCSSKTHKTYIQEVLSSNIGQDMGYPDWGFLWFSSFCLRKYLDSTLDHYCIHVLLKSSFINQASIQCCVAWETASVAKWTKKKYTASSKHGDCVTVHYSVLH
jgi:hypothetical protein